MNLSAEEALKLARQYSEDNNFIEAFKYYKIAADYGDADAMFQLLFRNEY